MFQNSKCNITPLSNNQASKKA